MKVFQSGRKMLGHNHYMFDGSTAARAIPPTPDDEVLTEPGFKKVKHSPWIIYEGMRMSLAASLFISQVAQDVQQMRARRLGS